MIDSPRPPAGTGEHRRIAKAAGVFGFFTLLSRILGLVRDQVTAYFFGVGPAADAFFVAFRFPNLLRRLSAEGAMSGAFVPIYAETLAKDGPEAAREVAGAAWSLLALILMVVSILGIYFSPEMVRAMAPGFSADPAKFELTVTLTRIIFPYILLISLAAMFMGQLNALGHFAVPAAAPMALNLVIIAFALVLRPWLAEPVTALAWGVLAGGLAQLLMQIRPLQVRNALPGLVWAPGLEPVRRMLRRMVPIIFGAAAYQINMLVVTFLASLLPGGAVSFLYYADRLVQFPLGIFGVALGTAILPSLSRQAAGSDWPGFTSALGFGFSLSLFIILPSAVGLVVLAEPLVSLIYGYGRFDQEAARQTALTLAAYGPGLPLFALSNVLTKAFNAQGDTRSPAKAAGWTVAANVALACLLMVPLRHVGLALASSLSAGLNLVLLWRSLKAGSPFLNLAGLTRGWGRIFLACLVLVLVVAGLVHLPFSPVSAAKAWLKVLLGVPLGAAAYFASARLLGCPELGALAGILRRPARPAARHEEVLHD